MRHTQRRKPHKDGDRVWNESSTSQGTRGYPETQKVRERHGMFSFRRNQSCQYLDFELLQNNERVKFPLLKGTNFVNLIYADDTPLVAESKEELKSLLMKVKEESENSWLKTQHSESEDHGIPSLHGQ